MNNEPKPEKVEIVHTATKNILHFHITQSNGTLQIPYEIKCQTIKFISAMVLGYENTNFTGPFYFRPEWIAADQSITNCLANNSVPLFLDYGSTLATLCYQGPSFRISSGRNIRKRFNYQLTDENGVLIPSNVYADVFLIFEYESTPYQ